MRKKGVRIGLRILRPETLAAEVLTEDELEVMGIVVRGERLLPAVPAGHPELGGAASPRWGAPFRATRSRGGLMCNCP